MRIPALACIALLCATVHAESGPPPGVLRARDLTPFGLQRLDLRATDMSYRPIGRWTAELPAAYQNTYVMSEDVYDYLLRRNHGRIPLQPEDAHALLAAPHDSYYVDVEVGVLDLILQRRLSQRFAVFVEMPYIHYGRRWLDGLIEDFHDAAGLSQMGRDLVARDSFQIVYRIGDARMQMLEREVAGGFGDPVVGVRYMSSQAGQWHFALEAAAKFPLAGERLLLSTGEADFGLQAATRRTFGRVGLQASAAVVHYSGGPESPADELIPTLIVSCSYAWTPVTSIISQAHVSRSAVPHTSIDELSDNKYQISLGLQSSVRRWTWTFAITENLGNYNNTPDVGFQLGLSYTGQ